MVGRILADRCYRSGVVGQRGGAVLDGGWMKSISLTSEEITALLALDGMTWSVRNNIGEIVVTIYSFDDVRNGKWSSKRYRGHGRTKDTALQNAWRRYENDRRNKSIT